MSEQNVNVEAVETTPATTAEALVPDNGSVAETLLGPATDDERKADAEFQASEDRLVDLAVQTLDPRDMLKKYAKLGGEALKLARKGKASLKPGSWSKDDYKTICDNLAKRIKQRVAIKDVRIELYVRIHLWVEAVRPLVPKVENLSYYQVANKFLPTLVFDVEDLSAEIKKGWIGWLTTAMERQIGDDPLSMKDLDDSINARKAEIERERASKTKPLSPEEELAKEQKAAEAKKRTERNAAQSKISDAIDKAIEAGHAAPADVAMIAEKVVKDHNMVFPKVGAFDPATCTPNDVLALANAMRAAGKFGEMRILRDTLDAMVKQVETALAAMQSKSA